jgi:predicted GNAT family N-acyltransferase
MSEFKYKLVENDSELEGAFEVRRKVFVEEQAILEDLVFNGSEREAMHMVVKDRDRIIGTARVRFLGAKQAKLERMAILEPFRYKGIGKKIISFLIEELKNRQIEKVILHAQSEVIEFYKACGFSGLGLPFWEAGIEHLKMEREI